MLRQQHLCHFLFFKCKQWPPNATSLRLLFLKAGLEREAPSFTYKLAFQSLITAIVSHERHKMVMPLGTQLTPVLSHPILPITPWWEPAISGQTYYLQCDRVLLPQNGGFDFPQWRLITVAVAAAAFPRSESRPAPEGKRAAPFQFFVLSLVSFIQLTDGFKKKTDQQTQNSLGTRLFFFFFSCTKQTHTKVSRAVTGCRTQNTPQTAELIITQMSRTSVSTCREFLLEGFFFCFVLFWFFFYEEGTKL